MTNNGVTMKLEEQIPACSVGSLAELNLVDKFLFDEVMEDTDAYRAVVSILLEKEIGLLEKPETEKELRVSPQLRQAQLDVSLLEPGSTDFNLLNDSCFILIAPFDLFGRGCTDTPLRGSAGNVRT